jgi:Family of unknown function (DUF5685)
MFGLMKARCCGVEAIQRVRQKEARRLQYCGTCKTMGRLYGQPSRLLLNYDAVFLGELLASLKPAPFAPAYASHNCFALPSPAQMPLSLQYAATANVLLGEFKLRDHVADSRSRKATMALHALSGAFGKAQRQLKTWRFPLDRVRELLLSQATRERESPAHFMRVIEPTATATRLVFEHGARLMGANERVIESTATIGEAFGRIAYLADAMQDQIEDTKTGDFNAMTATGTSQDTARAYLKTWQLEMLDALQSLPIATEQKELFGARLQANLTPYLTSGTILTMAGKQSLRDEENDKKKDDGCGDGSRCCDCCNACNDGVRCCHHCHHCHGCDCGGCHCHC